MKRQQGFTLIELIVVLVVLCFLLPVGIGWVWNIVKITQHDFNKPVTAGIVLRVVGVPAVPVGAVMGFISDEDAKK